MATTLKLNNAFISRFKALTKLQVCSTFRRFNDVVVEGGPQPHFHRDMSSGSDTEQCQIDMSKWKKMNSRNFGIDLSMISLPALSVLIRLRGLGFEAYLVGGCVRDLLLNRIPKDFDVITTANLKKIKQKFPRSQIVGRRFPICLVWLKGSVVEVSSFETVAKHDEVKQKVHFSQMPSGCDERDFIRWENCMHRDFTVNSLFFDPFANKIYDYTAGMKDLRSLKLQTVIPAQLSFTEDCARILRGLRIAARLGLSFSKETETAIWNLASSVKTLDKQRIMMELNYMLSYGAAKPSLCLLWRFNLLGILLPFHEAYLAQQAKAAESSMMFMKLFFNLDKLVTCDRPCHPCIWVGLLAFHMALVNNPQDACVVWTFSSVLYHGKWEEGVKFARKHSQALISFSPEVLEVGNSDSDEELAERVSKLASLVQEYIISLTEMQSLSASMSNYPDYPCSGLVFVSKKMAEHAAHIFDMLVNDIESYKEGRESIDIDYCLLGKGDLHETRFVLGKIIMDTMSSGVVQRVGKVFEEKNHLPMFNHEENSEALEEDCHQSLSDLVKHHMMVKEDRKNKLSSTDPALQQAGDKKQKLVDMNFNHPEQEIARKKQKTNNKKSKERAENEQWREMEKVENDCTSQDEVTRKQMVAEMCNFLWEETIRTKENVLKNKKSHLSREGMKQKKQKFAEYQEAAKEHLKVAEKDNLQMSTREQREVVDKGHLSEELGRWQNEERQLKKVDGRPLSSLFK